MGVRLRSFLPTPFPPSPSPSSFRRPRPPLQLPSYPLPSSPRRSSPRRSSPRRSSPRRSSPRRSSPRRSSPRRSSPRRSSPRRSSPRRSSPRRSSPRRCRSSPRRSSLTRFPNHPSFRFTSLIPIFTPHSSCGPGHFHLAFQPFTFHRSTAIPSPLPSPPPHPHAYLTLPVSHPSFPVAEPLSFCHPSLPPAAQPFFLGHPSFPRRSPLIRRSPVAHPPSLTPHFPLSLTPRFFPVAHPCPPSRIPHFPVAHPLFPAFAHPSFPPVAHPSYPPSLIPHFLPSLTNPFPPSLILHFPPSLTPRFLFSSAPHFPMARPSFPRRAPLIPLSLTLDFPPSRTLPPSSPPRPPPAPPVTSQFPTPLTPRSPLFPANPNLQAPHAFILTLFSLPYLSCCFPSSPAPVFPHFPGSSSLILFPLPAAAPDGKEGGTNGGDTVVKVGVVGADLSGSNADLTADVNATGCISLAMFLNTTINDYNIRYHVIVTLTNPGEPTGVVIKKGADVALTVTASSTKSAGPLLPKYRHTTWGKLLGKSLKRLGKYAMYWHTYETTGTWLSASTLKVDNGQTYKQLADAMLAAPDAYSALVYTIAYKNGAVSGTFANTTLEAGEEPYGQKDTNLSIKLTGRLGVQG
ncbi:unnamed protein product [Closterium sp. Yama58-4]|nr:unnamed protein product [Closterium sp. Yama58-4]